MNAATLEIGGFDASRNLAYFATVDSKQWTLPTKGISLGS